MSTLDSPLINPETTLTLTEAIPLFIKQMELRGSATTTQACYIRSLRKFAVFSKKEDNLNDITLKDIQDFLHHQHYICKFIPATVNTYRAALKIFYIVILDKDWHDLKVPCYKAVKTVSDIDSKNMQILITETKCHKDPYAILSEQCLLALRSYYKAYRPTNYLFPGQRYNQKPALRRETE